MLKRISTYCNIFTHDDIYEIACYCYFVYNLAEFSKTHSEIETGRKLCSLYRREVYLDNSYSCDIRTNKQLNDIIAKLNNEAYDTIIDEDTENRFVNSIMSRDLSYFFDENELAFCLIYVEHGSKFTGNLYNMSSSAVRKKFQRLIKKARKKI